MKYAAFTKKQLQLLTWWTPSSPFCDYNGVIGEGSVRAGKTLIMSTSFIYWSMDRGSGLQYGLAGKTIQSLRRNMITPLKQCLRLRGYKVIDKGTEGYIIVSKNKKINTYFLFGGKDERSQDLVQGITLAGILFDEVALMPQSFVNQALARCSVEGSKYWFNCNPEGPMHWFKTDFVDKADKLHLLDLHFGLDDNPSLSDKMKERYRTMFSGVFYQRFILGLWVLANGAIYDCYSEEKNLIHSDEEIPIKIREKDETPVYGCDYGVANPHVYLKCYIHKEPGDIRPYVYVTDEYYWNGRANMKQKTDEQYVNDFERFNDGDRFKFVVVDPSATSFIAALRVRGIQVRKADNDVNGGIAHVYTMMQTGHLKISPKCKQLLGEIGMYRWDDKAAEKGKEQVIKSNDHALDALRYVINTCISDVQFYYKRRGTLNVKKETSAA